MDIDWSEFTNPEFVIGTLLSGLLLSVLATYLVRLLDRFRSRWSSAARARLERAEARHREYVAFGSASVQGYGALAAEAARLRARSNRRLLIVLGAVGLLWFVFEFGTLRPGWRAGPGIFVIGITVVVAAISYALARSDELAADAIEVALFEVRKHHGISMED